MSHHTPGPRYLTLDLSPYAGKYIALVEGRVIAVGETAEAALVMARAARPQRYAAILRIAADTSPTPPPRLATLDSRLLPLASLSSPPRLAPPMTNLHSQPLAHKAHTTLLALAPQAVLVGGAVRDLLLGLPLRDLDYVLPGDALPVARALADALGAAYYPLDERRGTGRVVWQQPEGAPLVVDIASLGSSSLDDDLRARDFTINAIALAPGDVLYDPLGGVPDLQNRTLRPCSDHSLVADPVRVLRAVRFLCAFELQPAPGWRHSSGPPRPTSTPSAPNASATNYSNSWPCPNPTWPAPNSHPGACWQRSIPSCCGCTGWRNPRPMSSTPTTTPSPPCAGWRGSTAYSGWQRQ